VQTRKQKLKNQLDNIIEESSEEEGKSEDSYDYDAETARKPILLAPPTPQKKISKQELVD